MGVDAATLAVALETRGTQQTVTDVKSVSDVLHAVVAPAAQAGAALDQSGQSAVRAGEQYRTAATGVTAFITALQAAAGGSAFTIDTTAALAGLTSLDTVAQSVKASLASITGASGIAEAEASISAAAAAMATLDSAAQTAKTAVADVGASGTSLSDIDTSATAAAGGLDALTASASGATTQLAAQSDAVGRTSDSHREGAAAVEGHASAMSHFSQTGGVLSGVLGEMGIPVNELKEHFSQLKEGIGAAASEEGTALEATGALSAGLVGLAAIGIAKSIEGFVELTDRVHEISETTGVTAPTVQGLSYALQTIGESADAAQRPLMLLERNAGTLSAQLDAGKLPTGTFASALSDIGISAERFVSANPDERLRMIMQGFSGLTEEANKTKIAMDLFGRQGASMIGILGEGTAALDQGIAKTAAYGVNVGDSWDAVQKWHTAQADLNLGLQSFEVEIGSAVIPAISNFISGIAQAELKAHEFLSTISGGHDILGGFWKSFESSVPILNGITLISQFGDKAKTTTPEVQKLSDTLNINSGAMLLFATAADLANAKLGVFDLSIQHNTDSQSKLAAAAAQTELDQAALAATAKQTADALMVSANASAEGLGVGGIAAGQMATALTTLETAAKNAGKSTTEATVFQQQFANALDFASRSSDTQRQITDALNNSTKNSDAAHQSATKSQIALNEAVALYGPEAAAAVIATQQMADAWSAADANGGDVAAQLDLIRGAMVTTKDEAAKLHSEVLGMFSRPTQEELDLKAQIASLDDQMKAFNATLANDSPALQHVAAMQKAYDQSQLTGQSLKQQQAAKDALDLALANTGPQGAAVAEGQHHVDILERQRAGLQGTYDGLVAHNTALLDNTVAASGNAPKQSDLNQLYDAQGGKVSTAAGNVRDLTAATVDGAPKQVEAVKPVAAAYDAVGTAIVGAHTKYTNFLSAVSSTIGQLGSAIAGAAHSIPGSGQSTSGFAPGSPGDQVFGGSSYTGGTAGQNRGLIPPTISENVTQGYGNTGFYLEPAGHGVDHWHAGIDVGVGPGTPLVAGGAGTVAYSDTGNTGYGRSVTITFDDGSKEIIGHLSQAIVQTGDRVAAGQQIGFSGSTGNSDGPHVHYEVHDPSGVDVNPATFVLGGGGSQSTASAAGSGLLPASWYAAIQANESTLPLPSPGRPQPMFGFIPGAPGSVGAGSYTSGGTAEASASIGAAAGMTNQSLFPTVDAGIGALDRIVKGNPAAMAAVQAGDFAGMLRALAPTYAGPGEVAGWPGQVLSHYNPNATFPGGAGASASSPVPVTVVPSGSAGSAATTGISGFGALPTPAPEPGVTPLTPDQLQAAINSADTALDQLSRKWDQVETGVVTGTQHVTQAQVDADQRTMDSAKANAETKIAEAQRAEQAVKDAIDSGASPDEIKHLQQVASQSTATANQATTDWSTAAAKFKSDTQGMTADAAASAQARLQSESTTYNATVALWNLSTQQYDLMQQGLPKAHVKANEQIVASDKATFQNYQTEAMTASQEVARLTVDSTNAQLKLSSDLANHESDDVIRKDTIDRDTTAAALQRATQYFQQLTGMSSKAAQQYAADWTEARATALGDVTSGIALNQTIVGAQRGFARSNAGLDPNSAQFQANAAAISQAPGLYRDQAAEQATIAGLTALLNSPAVQQGSEQWNNLVSSLTAANSALFNTQDAISQLGHVAAAAVKPLEGVAATIQNQKIAADSWAAGGAGGPAKSTTPGQMTAQALFDSGWLPRGGEAQGAFATGIVGFQGNQNQAAYVQDQAWQAAMRQSNPQFGTANSRTGDYSAAIVDALNRMAASADRLAAIQQQPINLGLGGAMTQQQQLSPALVGMR